MGRIVRTGFIFMFAVVLARGAEDLASRVVLLANAADGDSLRVAEHYAEVRGVPKANIIALPMSRAETISWGEFLASIWAPLQDELVKRAWIDAIPMKLTDELGRRKLAMSGHRISYLVVCRGVPLRIMHEPLHYVAAPPYTANAQFRTNAGAVDAELSLLARPDYAINAFTPNPLFRNERPTELEAGRVIKVSRLDGPTVEDTLALVDRAVTAEQTGLLGRAYVDIGGAHASGERWLEATAKRLGELGFDLEVDRGRATLPATARFDAPVLYFGWYAGQVNGPFKLPGFRFPPGAVALHIHSYSAQSVRAAEQHWVGPLVARGVTATVGNVFEPYLELTHRPDLLLRALARGDNFGDAAYYALPALSWQPVAIGDPLYRPFAMSAERQWERRGEISSSLLGYATVRRMNALIAAGKAEEAVELGRTEQRERPSLAVGMALAQQLHAAGEVAGAANAIGFVTKLKRVRADEWALVRESAELLKACGRAEAAVEIYRELLGARELPRALRMAWLPPAIGAAAAKEPGQADRWRKELSRLSAEDAVKAKGK